MCVVATYSFGIGPFVMPLCRSAALAPLDVRRGASFASMLAFIPMGSAALSGHRGRMMECLLAMANTNPDDGAYGPAVSLSDLSQLQPARRQRRDQRTTRGDCGLKITPPKRAVTAPYEKYGTCLPTDRHLLVPILRYELKRQESSVMYSLISGWRRISCNGYLAVLSPQWQRSAGPPAAVTVMNHATAGTCSWPLTRGTRLSPLPRVRVRPRWLGSSPNAGFTEGERWQNGDVLFNH